MTLEEAIAVLNEHRHEFRPQYGPWRAFPCGKKAYLGYTACLEPYIKLTAFEAVAVAEKYLRESAGEESR